MFSFLFVLLVSRIVLSNPLLEAAVLAERDDDESSGFPPYLVDDQARSRSPWYNIDLAGPPPQTGKIRRYEFFVDRGVVRPDGTNKTGILINGQFPGPLIEANWGDTIQVKVTNSKDLDEGTAVHWHGLTQVKSQYYDGVPGVSQCPLAPGKSFTYTFRADQYGTSWYHSHYSAQYVDGAFGPIMIYGPVPSDVSYDVDLGTVLLSDYILRDYFSVLQGVFQIPPVFPNVDNNLWNGKGLINCAQTTKCDPYAKLPRYRFRPGRIYRLRLINSGGSGTEKFTIDNHEMTVIANDFVPVKPYKTKVVTIGVGQRTDIIIKATGQSTDAVFMRADLDTDCLNLTYTNSHALAPVLYPNARRNTVPTTTATPWLSDHCRNDPLDQTVPYYPITPPAQVATSRMIDLTVALNATGHLLFFVDNSSFRTNYNQPVFLLSKLGNTSYPDSPQWNVYNFGSNSSVRIIMRNYFEIQHPMHLHGHNFWVLAEGRGEWDGKIVNPSNPQRRDTHIMQPGTPDNPSFVVFEWVQDNPGIWPFHCHLQTHISAGLGILVMEQPQKIQNVDVPRSLAQTCRDWARYTGTEVVTQIDSGL